MRPAATSLAGGRLATETHPLHPARRTAGERDKLEAWSRRALRVLRDLDLSKRGATEAGQVQVLTNTLIELATAVSTDDARSGTPLFDGPARSMQHAPAFTDAFPDTRTSVLHTETATILVADVDGDSETAGHDENHWTRPLFHEHVAGHGAVEVDVPGASFAAAFPGPREALLCAIALQRTMAGRAADHPAEPMRVRIGLHAGEPTREAPDRVAETSLVATRIAAHARGGEILVSSRLREIAGSDLRFGAGRTVDIEGAEEAHTAYEVCWAGEVPAPPAVRGVFRRDRDHWTIAWRGGRCLLRDVRGLSYVARLLREPGREFHALDLVGARRSELSVSSLGLAAFDDHVRAACRRELDDLREEIQEAERLCDLGRVERSREAREMLQARLATAVGLAGHDRQSAAAAERARCTVAQAIRVALKRIHGGVPALGDELRLRIITGMYCVYVPDPVHPTDWLM
jgi:class 3 adenylate cyclase